ETTQLCHWHVPQAHYLESWGDTRSYDGTITIMQPLIEPLYDGKTPYELLAVFSEQYDRKPLEIVKSYWQQHWQASQAPEAGNSQGQTAGAGSGAGARGAQPLTS